MPSDYTPESRLAGQFGRARRVINDALETVLTGTADNPKRMKRVDLALQRAYDHAQNQAPALHVWETVPDDEEAKKSPPPPLIPNEDRERQQRTIRQATKDHARLIAIGKDLDRLIRDAEKIINRQAETVHESKLPVDVLPGCRSCARKQTETEPFSGTEITVGGHFAPVYAKAPHAGLCRWCYDFEKHYGQLPPVKACHKYHRESPRSAGLFIAGSTALQAAAAKVEAARLAAILAPEPDELPACPNTWTDMERGVVHPCLRPQGHPPGCRGSYQGQSIAFPGGVPA